MDDQDRQWRCSRPARRLHLVRRRFRPENGLEPPPAKDLAARLMYQLHGPDLLRVEVSQETIWAILQDGRALEYDALGRQLSRGN